MYFHRGDNGDNINEQESVFLELITDEGSMSEMNPSPQAAYYGTVPRLKAGMDQASVP